MITINLLSQVELPYLHSVRCNKSIGSFKKGKSYTVKIIPCKGRIYKPGFKMVGEREVWNDKVGTLDNRLMVSEATFKDGAYTCAAVEDIHAAFEES